MCVHAHVCMCMHVLRVMCEYMYMYVQRMYIIIVYICACVLRMHSVHSVCLCVVYIRVVSLDREQYSQYELLVVAIDQGLPALTGSTTVSINIIGKVGTIRVQNNYSKIKLNAFTSPVPGDWWDG